MPIQILKFVLSLTFSYLIGSIPTGFLFGKMIKGIDIRQFGSGNMGATNVARVLGKKLGITVLALDILKGTLAVLVSQHLFYSTQSFISEYLFLCGNAIAVVSGHNWTIFLKFKGGKGIATSLGALIAFSILIHHFIWVVLSVLILWIIIFLASGFVSLGSIICSALLPVFAVFFHIPPEITLLLSLFAVFSLIRHKSNIMRLLQKKESRFNTRKIFNKLKK